MAQTAALYHVSFKSYKKNTKVSYILKPILVSNRFKIVANSAFSFFHFLYCIRQALHTLVSLVRDCIVRIDINMRRQDDFKDRTEELRSIREPQGQQRSDIFEEF